MTPHGRRRCGSPFWAFFNLYAILFFRRENWPRPTFFPMPVVRWEMPARLDTSEHLLRRLLFDSLPKGCHRGILSLVRHTHRALCQQRLFFQVAQHHNEEPDVRTLSASLSTALLWIRERLVVAACIIPFMIRLLLRKIKVQHIAASMSLMRDSSCTHGSRLCASASVQLALGDHLRKMFKLDVPPKTGLFTVKWGTLWIGTCKWCLSVRFMWAWEISSCTTFSSTPAIAPSSPTASVLLFFVEAWLYVEKHTGESPTSHGQTTGDSSCHEIGMSLIDECTALDKPLHGWIESDLFALGSRHTRPSIDDRGENCAFACDTVRPCHAFFAPLLEPAVPNFCAQLSVWSHFDRTP